MLKISFVITVYNKEKYIADVITAIKDQQTNSDCEYIFINDGSSDDSLSIIERESRGLDNCTVINQKNSGVVASTLKGIELAKGEYIKFVDGDDLLLPHIVRLQEQILDEDPELSYVSCSRGTLHDGKIVPSFSVNQVLEELPLRPEDIIYLSGAAALLTTMIRNKDFPECLTGMTVGMSRRSSFNISLAKKISEKYGIRQMQDHLLSTVSLLNNVSSLKFIKRIGTVELSKSNHESIRHSLSANTKNAREETMLINYSLKDYLAPQEQLKLMSNDIRPLYRSIYGKASFIDKLNLFSLYNKIRRANKNSSSEQVERYYSDMIKTLEKNRLESRCRPKYVH